MAESGGAANIQGSGRRAWIRQENGIWGQLEQHFISKGW